MARKNLRIQDLPDIEKCTFFIEYDKAPLPDTYVLIEDYKPVSTILLKSCCIIPDPDEEVDGWHVFIKRSKIPPVFYVKNSEFFKKLRYEAQKEIVKEALEKGLVQVTKMGIIGDQRIKIWCRQLIDEMEYHL